MDFPAKTQPESAEGLSTIREDFVVLNRSLRQEIEHLLVLLRQTDINTKEKSKLDQCKMKARDARHVVVGGGQPKPSSDNRTRYNGRSCAFCRSNGETSDYSESHYLRDHTGKVTCPILRAYVCPICSATGDVAHTIRYCPLNKTHDVPVSVLKQLRKSAGKRAFH